ncbi:MAG: hypothetical protein QNJ92_00535 [Alphaproteobacteria bacterium]|nr:hypothetical protein [Alphaproteobacteria bacterium]
MDAKKIGALIPVRLSSERLPGKALKELCERPVLYHLLDRVCASRHIATPRDVVVCTTREASDDRLVEATERYGCSVYRGSAFDIIRRFGDAMCKFGFDAVIHANGDNPLSATECMDATLDRLLSQTDLDIVTMAGLPLGTATTAFTRRAMDKVLRAYRTEHNDTGFIYYFTRAAICEHMELGVNDPAHTLHDARLTLDYPEDLGLLRSIFEALYRPGEVFPLAAVTAFLREHPELIRHNLKRAEEYSKRTAEKVNLAFAGRDGSVHRIHG